jgi:hypothetical protein
MLIIVLGALLLIVAWRYLSPGDDEPIVPPVATARTGDPEEGGRPAPGPPGVPGAPGASARRPGASPGASNNAPVREVLDLAPTSPRRDAQSYTPGRDPWRFYDPPPLPPPVHKKTAAELAAERAAAELAARQAAEAAEKARQEALIPKPPPFTLKYLGNFGPAGPHYAVFKDGQTVFFVKEGGVIDGKFTVNHIGFESVDIGFVGFPNVKPLVVPAGH